MKLESLTLANFRGFKNEVRIPFGPQITLLVGPNGFGKSTVLDAVEWLLTGQLSRYQGSDEGRKEDYLRHIDADNEPFIEASFQADEQSFTLRRERKSPQKSLLMLRPNLQQKWVSESEMAAFLKQIDPEITTVPGRSIVFSEDFISYHLLGQQTIQNFVVSEPRERYEKLAPIIGVDRYVKLTELLLQSARKLGERYVVATKLAGESADQASQRRQAYENTLQSLSGQLSAGMSIPEWLLGQYEQLQKLVPVALRNSLPDTLPTKTTDILSTLDRTLPGALFWLSARDKELQQRIESFERLTRDIEFLFERQTVFLRLQESTSSSESRLTYLSQNLTTAKRTLQESENTESNATAELRRLRHDIARLDTLTHHRAEFERSHLRWEQLSEENRIEMDRIQSNEAQLLQMEETVSRLNSEASSLEQAQKDGEKTLIELRSLAVIVNNLKSQQPTVENETLKLADIREQQDGIAKNTKQLNSKMEEMKILRTQTEQRLQSLASEGQSVQKLLVEIRKVITTSKCPVCSTTFPSNEALLNAVDETLSAHDPRLDLATAEQRKIVDAQEQLASEIRESERKTRECETTIREITERATRYESTMYQYRSRAAALGLSATSSLVGDFELLSRQIKDASSAAEQRNTKIATLQTELSQQKALLTQLVSDIQNHQIHGKNLTNLRDEALRSRDKADEELLSIGRSLNLSDLSPSSVGGRKTQLEQGIAVAEKNAKSLEKRSSEMRKQVQDLEKEVAPLLNQRKEFERLEAELRLLESRCREALLAYEFVLGPTVISDIKQASDRALGETVIFQEARKCCENLIASVEAGKKSISLDEQKRSLEIAEKEEARLRMSAATIESAQSVARELADKIREAGENRTKRILGSCSMLIENYYNRIYPHPLWSKLTIDVDRDASRGGRAQLVMAASRPHKMSSNEQGFVGQERSLNIRYTFSTGQLNLFAISLVLALAQQRGKELLPSMFLDDPVQAMDDMRIAELCWVLLQTAKQRQIIIATGNQNFAELLFSRVMSIRKEVSIIAHLFEGMTSSGPSILLNWKTSSSEELDEKVA